MNERNLHKNSISVLDSIQEVHVSPITFFLQTVEQTDISKYRITSLLKKQGLNFCLAKFQVGILHTKITYQSFSYFPGFKFIRRTFKTFLKYVNLMDSFVIENIFFHWALTQEFTFNFFFLSHFLSLFYNSGVREGGWGTRYQQRVLIL